MKRALLVIDVQNEYFTGKLPVTYPEGSLGRILQAMDAARAAGIPVVLIRHGSPQKDATAFVPGSNGWEIHPDILARPYSILIDKRWPGSFTDTGLEAFLRAEGVDTVVISGYMTQMCCDTTARQAVHLGFGAEFLSDATGTLNIANSAGSIAAADLHKAILITQAMRFSRVLTAGEWIAEVAGR